MSLHGAVKWAVITKATTWVFATVAAVVVAIDPTIKIALVASAPAAITGLFTLLLGYLNRKELQNIKVNVDGRLTELLRAQGTAKYAEGRQKGVEAEQARMRPADPPPPEPPKGEPHA